MVAGQRRGGAPGGGTIRKDWPLILAAALGFSVSSIHFYSFGLFMEPLEQEFGWSRSQISGTLMIISTIGVLSGPLVGMMIDRWGSRRVGLPGVIAYTTAFASLALVGPSIWSFWAIFILLGLAISTITATVWSAAVAARFAIRQRGLAIALTFCGASLGMLVAPIFAEHLMSHHGWRVAYVGLSALFAALALPMIVLFFFDPQGVRVDSDDAAEPVVVPGGVEIPLREALRSWRYWTIVLVGLVASVGALALTAHFVPLVTETGISRVIAASAAGTIGLASASGRILEGYLLDRCKGPAIGAVSLMLPTLACLLVLFVPPSASWAVAVALVLGAAVGAEVNILAYLTSRYFGVRHYGVLFGIVYSMVIVGGGLGPLLGGVIYDATKSYDMLAWTVLPMCIACAVLVLMMGPYPVDRDAEPA